MPPNIAEWGKDMDFNGRFEHKKIETNQDILQAYEIYLSNAKYFHTVAGREPELQDVSGDRLTSPHLVPESRVHFELYMMGGRPVAVLDAMEGYPQADMVYIDFFMVDGKLHRKGIGRALLAQIEEQAVQSGYSRIHLGVWDQNKKAMAFWKTVGYEQVKEVETQSPYGQTWNVHVMEKKISARGKDENETKG